MDFTVRSCAAALVEVEKAEDSDEHLPAKEVASRDAAFAGLVGDTAEHLLAKEVASSSVADANDGLVGDSAEHLPAKEVASSDAFVSSISSSNSDPVKVSESLLTSATMLLL